jgi:hypothetical protein
MDNFVQLENKKPLEISPTRKLGRSICYMSTHGRSSSNESGKVKVINTLYFSTYLRLFFNFSNVIYSYI